MEETGVFRHSIISYQRECEECSEIKTVLRLWPRIELQPVEDEHAVYCVDCLFECLPQQARQLLKNHEVIKSVQFHDGEIHVHTDGDLLGKFTHIFEITTVTFETGFSVGNNAFNYEENQFKTIPVVGESRIVTVDDEGNRLNLASPSPYREEAQEYLNELSN